MNRLVQYARKYKWSIVFICAIALGAVGYFFPRPEVHAFVDDPGEGLVDTSSSFDSFLRIEEPEEYAIRCSAAGNPIEICSNASAQNISGFTGDGIKFFVTAFSGATTSELRIGNDLIAQGLNEQNVDKLRLGVDIHNRSKEGISTELSQTTAKIIETKPSSAITQFSETIYAVVDGDTVSAQNADNAGFYYPGTGFSLLQPIQEFWGWSVNVVYGFLIFIVVGIALAILFRAKLSGGAEITIQSAIPNIAIAMILVPLSYAISGLFIDAVTLGTNAAHEFVIGSQSPAHEALLDYREKYPDGRDLYPDDPRMTWLVAGGNASLRDEVSNIILGDGGSPETGFGAFITNMNSTLASSPFFDNDVGVQNWIASLINFVIQVILFLTGLRILVKLLRKFLYFIIFPIFSPFVFASIAIPGNGAQAIQTYLKYMGSASLFYIVTYLMFLLTYVFSNVSFQQSIPDFATNGYIPPLLGFYGLLGNIADSQVSTTGTALIMGIIAIGIYLNIPRVLDSINQQLGIKDALPEFLTGTWQSLQDSINVGRQGINLTRQGAQAAYNAPNTVLDNTIGRTQRFFGIQDDDYRSYKNFIGRQAARVTARTDRLAEQARSVRGLGGVAKLASAGTRGLVNTAAGSLGGDAARITTTGGEDDGRAQLTAEFQFAGQKGLIKMDNKQVKQVISNTSIVNISPVGGGGGVQVPRVKGVQVQGTYFQVRGGKIILKMENGKLPPLLNNQTLSIRMAIGEGLATANTKYRRKNIGSGDQFSEITGDFGRPADNPLIPFGQFVPLFFLNPPVNGDASHTYIGFEQPEFPANSARTEVEIGVNLFISGANGPQGQPGNNIGLGKQEFLQHIADNFVQTNEIVFMVNNISSNPLKTMFDAEFVGNLDVLSSAPASTIN